MEKTFLKIYFSLRARCRQYSNKKNNPMKDWALFMLYTKNIKEQDYNFLISHQIIHFLTYLVLKMLPDRYQETDY